MLGHEWHLGLVREYKSGLDPLRLLSLAGVVAASHRAVGRAGAAALVVVNTDGSTSVAATVDVSTGIDGAVNSPVGRRARLGKVARGSLSIVRLLDMGSGTCHLAVHSRVRRVAGHVLAHTMIPHARHGPVGDIARLHHGASGGNAASV